LLAGLADPLTAKGSTLNSPVAQRFHITRWTAEDGLPQNRISALAQTPDGYLWIGTWFGLARFDGVRFVVFDAGNTPALKRDAVTALAVDRADGGLWIGTSEGLVRLKDRQFTRAAEGDAVARWDISSLTAAAGGGVWARRSRQVAFHRDHTIALGHLGYDTDDNCRAEWETAEGNLAVATTRDLVEVARDGTLRDRELPAGIPAELWRAGFYPKDHAGRVWVTGGTGLFVLAEGKWQTLQPFPSRHMPNDRFLEDRGGGVWAACTDVGLWRYSEAGAESIQLDLRGAEKAIACLLEDLEGNVWIGAEEGLFRLRPALIRAVTREHGLPADNCRSVCQAPNGAFWVETANGVARLDGGQVQTFPDEPTRVPVCSIAVDPEGRVWLGDGHAGLIIWREGAATNHIWERTRENPTVDAFYLDRAGRMWVGTSAGATWFERSRPAARWGEFGLPKSSVRAIYQTRDGAMWFGSWKAGAMRWKGNGAGEKTQAGGMGDERSVEVTWVTTEDGLADDRVFVFHEDPEGALWIGTHNGLTRYKNGRCFTFRTKHGLLDNLINWLEEDEFGHLWLSCNRGIFRMDRRELNAVADGAKPRANAAVYGTADGMPSPETNGEHQPAGCKGRDGRIWFPTTQGVVVIDPRLAERSKEEEIAPTAIIEQVVADDEVVFGDGQSATSATKVAGRVPPELPAGRGKLLRVRYTAACFADPRRVRFQYRLGSLEKDWREVTDERTAYYTDLKPGRYNFQIKAASPHGVWNNTPAGFQFTVRPHFYETYPFYALCVFALLALGAGVQKYRLRVQRQILELDHQRTMEQERARLARDLHDELGTALTGLALEMDVARRNVEDPSAVGDRLRGMANSSRALAARMREVVWAINPRCDDVPGLAAFLEQHAAPFVELAGLRCRLDFPESLPSLPLTAEVRHQLALGVREALTNVVRHARAREVTLGLRLEDNVLIVRIRDDGVGFDLAASPGARLGRTNLASRLEQLGGAVKYESSPGQGTTVTFQLPLSKSFPGPQERAATPEPSSS
jgi:ligand-binding sensor domain-containing protein/signal transduction histidine kinase